MFGSLFIIIFQNFLSIVFSLSVFCAFEWNTNITSLESCLFWNLFLLFSNLVYFYFYFICVLEYSISSYTRIYVRTKKMLPRLTYFCVWIGKIWFVILLFEIYRITGLNFEIRDEIIRKWPKLWSTKILPSKYFCLRREFKNIFSRLYTIILYCNRKWFMFQVSRSIAWLFYNKKSLHDY